jgi:hypothetical protein
MNKMKKIKLFVFSFLIVILLVSCENENINMKEYDENPKTTHDFVSNKTIEPTKNVMVDTQVGNIANYGIAAKNGEWIYFSSMEEGLCKMKEDGSSKTLILPDKSITYINIVDDYIYYTSLTNGSKLYRIKTDGTGIRMLSENGVSDVHVVDKWIYFINEGEGEYKICKMKTNGSELSEISSRSVSALFFVDDTIYYRQREYDGKLNKYRLCRMNSDGTNKTKILDEDIRYFRISGDWIYYVDKDNYNIYKVRLDGSEKTKINADKSSYINVVGEWIYYVNYGDTHNHALYKIKTDGSSRTKVLEETGLNMHYLNIIDDWIYYVKVDFLGATYRVNIDGSENMRLSINNYDTSWRAREEELSEN